MRVREIESGDDVCLRLDYVNVETGELGSRVVNENYFTAERFSPIDFPLYMVPFEKFFPHFTGACSFEVDSDRDFIELMVLALVEWDRISWL